VTAKAIAPAAPQDMAVQANASVDVAPAPVAEVAKGDEASQVEAAVDATAHPAAASAAAVGTPAPTPEVATAVTTTPDVSPLVDAPAIEPIALETAVADSTPAAADPAEIAAAPVEAAAGQVASESDEVPGGQANADETPADQAAQRAEQLRGLFDAARDGSEDQGRRGA
jgi:hypothetical protein